MKQTETLSNVLEKEITSKEFNLILHNDPITPFEVVIEALIRFCNHERLQAEQCTHIIHHNGRLSVKQGSYRELEIIANKLHSIDLTCEIE